MSIHRLFSGLWGVLFLALFLFVFTYANFLHNADVVAITASFIGQAALFILLYGVCTRYKDYLALNEALIVPITLLVFFMVQVYFAYHLAITTAWDVQAVYLGASNIATTGSLGQFSDYFHMFPHNLGAVTLLTLVFSAASFFGIDDLYTVGCIVNIIIIDLAFIFIYLIIKRLRGVHDAFHGLLLCFCCLPLLFYTPVFYTDTLSICFAVMVFYGFLRFLDSQEFLLISVLIAVASGLALYLGGSIKITAIFMLIAIVMVAIADGQIKKGLVFAGILIVVYQLLSSVIQHTFYDHHLNSAKLESTKIPYTHWMMMGLQGNGSYSPSDYELTKSLNSQGKRVAANVGLSIERIYDMGYDGFFELGKKKQLNNFGSGTYDLHDMLDDGPIRKGHLHEYVLAQGEHHRLFTYLCHGFHLLLLCVVALSAIADAFSGKANEWLAKNTLRVSLLGLFSFLLFWETSSRYMLNYLPVFILLTQLGIADFYNKMQSSQLITRLRVQQ